MNPRTVIAYPGAPLPPRSRRKARLLGLAACVAIGALTERDHVAQLLAGHQKDCTKPGCPDCASLQAHAERTERQLALLTPPDTETESLF